jgi:tetratricopeptide (TPR) repeat protein
MLSSTNLWGQQRGSMLASANQRCPHFVGREHEKEIFQVAVNSLKSPPGNEKRQVITLHAWGGYGKTCLLKEFISYCQSDIVPFIYVNFEEQKISSLVRFLAAIEQSFTRENIAGSVDHRLFAAFHQRLVAYRPSNIVNDGQPFSGEFVELIGKQFSPPEDKAAAVQPYKVETSSARSLMDRLTGRKRDTISEADLVREVLTAINYSHESKPLVILLDAYEWAIKRNLDEYIQAQILSAVNPPVLIVISGRQEMVLSGKLLPQVCPNPLDLRLGPLSKEDAREYIQQVHPIQSEQLLDLALETAEGVPLGLRLVVNAISNYRNDKDAFRILNAMGVIGVRANVVEILTTKWLRELPPAIQNSTKAASILREFDLESLTYLLENTDSPVIGLPDLSMRITGRSGRGWAIHEEMRQVIRDFVRLSDWESFRLWNKRAADFFHKKILDVIDQPTRFQDEQWKRDSTEWIYHTIQYNEAEGFDILLHELNDALWEVEYDDCLSYLDAIAELGYFDHEPWLIRLREAIDHSTRDDHQKAIQAFKSLLQADPPSSRAILQHLAIDNIGYRLRKVEDWPQAQKALEDSLEFYRLHNDFFKLATAQEQIAESLDNQMKLIESQEWREKALENYRNAKNQPFRLVDATFQEATILSQLGRKEEAINQLSIFLEKEKPSVSLTIRWARFLSSIDKWEDAIDAWKRVGELSGDQNAWAWEIIGDIYVNQLKDLNHGINAYEKSFQNDQSRWSALRHAAEAFESVEQWEDAAEMHSRAGLIFDEIKIPALANAARCLARSGKVDEAEKNFNELLEKDPTDVDLLKQWFQFLSQQQRWQEAVDVLNQIAEVSTVDQAEALEAAGNILHQQLGDNDRAISALQKSFEADPTRWTPLNLAAQTFEDSEQWQNASQTYRRIAENFTSLQATALANAARCLGRSGNNEEGENILRELVQKQRWEEAATVYLTIAGVSDQDAAWAWENAGDIFYHHLHALDQAIAAYENSYQADNNRWTALRQASLAYEGAERWLEAAEAHDRAAKAAPHIRYAAWAYAARCVAQAGELEEAKTRFEKLAEEAPNDLEVLSQWLQFLENQNAWEQAILVHKKIADASDNNRADAWEHIGTIYAERLHNLEKAIEAFETSIKYDEKRWSAIRQSALAYEQFYQWEKAASSHLRAAAVNPDIQLLAKASAARCSGRAGNIGQAEEQFKNLRTEATENVLVQWEYAQYLEDQQRFDDAIHILTAITELSNEVSPAAWERIGDIYAFHLKDLHSAIQTYLKSIQADPNRWTSLRQMAAAYENFEEWLFASQTHERAVELIPTFKSIGKANAARCLGRSGEVEKAEKIFTDLLEENPDSIPIQEQWASFLEHQERWREAVDVYQAVIPFSEDKEGRLMQYARGCEILDRQEDALRTYQELENLLSKQPHNMTASRRLAWVFFKTGRFSEAKQKISEISNNVQMLDRVRSLVMKASMAFFEDDLDELEISFNELVLDAPLHSDIIWEAVHDITYISTPDRNLHPFINRILDLSRRSFLDRD